MVIFSIYYFSDLNKAYTCKNALVACTELGVGVGFVRLAIVADDNYMLVYSGKKLSGSRRGRIAAFIVGFCAGYNV